MKKISCPYCSSNNCTSDYQLTWPDERFPNYSVASCSDCTIGFVLPLPTKIQLHDLYNSIAYHDKDRAAGNLWDFDDAQLTSEIKKESTFISKYQLKPYGGRALDVGSGWGTLLKALELIGYQTTGIELSETASQFAKNKLGLNIFNLPIEELHLLPDEDYELITARHVLEHFYDPREVLLRLRERLTSNGKIIIQVPDYGSYDRKEYGDDWPAFGPYHLWYFTRPSLERLLDDAGFEIIRFDTFLSDRICSGNSHLHRNTRRILNRLGAGKFLTGRTIGLVAKTKS